MTTFSHLRSDVWEWTKGLLKALGGYLLLIKAVCRDVLKEGVDIRELSRQTVLIGVRSFPIVALTAIFTGMVMALQTAYGLQRFGAKTYVANLVGLALTRELGPVLSALMVCGRCGAGIAAEISSMVATEQVDAIRALGANHVRKLVSPKVIAGTVCLPILVVFADVIGIFGGWLVATMELDITTHSYIQALLYTLVIRDVFDGLVKATVFGFLVTSIACYKGLITKGGTEGVGNSTTEAVVVGSIVIFVADFIITKILILINF
jgi:phospholipid/cholesterol/gamma-HCH transport system permease protein